ncbi:hypothetical protein H0H87_004623 [Tephrocybe sp. NHM501043]|nr:hypothetical protein H0H87_004623 [Tephrocybe sp. NHM501043]
MVMLTHNLSGLHHLLGRVVTDISSASRTVRIIPIVILALVPIPASYRIPAIVSSVAVTIAAFAIFIWALAKQGNGGPLFSDPEAVYGAEKLRPGTMLGWVMIRCVTSGIGGWAGGIVACGVVGGMDLAALAPK